MISVPCPHCGAVYELDEALAGRRALCGNCKTHFKIEKSSAVPQKKKEKPEKDATAPAKQFSQGPSIWITCPHCWQKFDFKDINYISRHLDLLGDPVLGADAQKRFLPVKFSARGMAIDDKGMECPEMACPHCHLKIPESVVDLPSSIFSIVGAPSSGKSYLLTTMMWQIRKCLPHYFEYNIGDVDSTFNAVLNEYESVLFMNNHPESPVSLPKTELQGSGYTNQIIMNGFPVDLPKPFIFALTPMPGHPRFDKDRKELERNIILYDNAGEHFQPGHEQVNNLATNHLAFSDGIIFVYDPLRDAHMQKFCAKDDPQFQQESTNQLALFYEMAARVRKFSGLQMTDKYRQPLIVAIAKFDVLRESLGLQPKNEDFLKYDETKMEYSLDLQNVTNMSFLLREKLLEIAPEFVGAAEGFSETVYFVPVSSFGTSPKPLGNGEQNAPSGRKQALGIIPDEMKPFWTEVPFLLHLYLHGLISAVMPPVEGAEKLEHFRFSNDTITFTFPGAPKRYQLPRIYWGMSLYCEAADKYYTLPVPGNYTRGQTCQATSLDEQIDTGFWSRQ
ncbi:MAG: hypothetical protein J6A21_07790 [Lentisphaeria bacterium]|nr:hypothetical protein [Lentisphaeria bacterium]